MHAGDPQVQEAARLANGLRPQIRAGFEACRRHHGVRGFPTIEDRVHPQGAMETLRARFVPLPCRPFQGVEGIVRHHQCRHMGEVQNMVNVLFNGERGKIFARLFQVRLAGIQPQLDHDRHNAGGRLRKRRVLDEESVPDQVSLLRLCKRPELLRDHRR